MAISYPLRIPDNLIALAELRRREMYVDKATAIRQLLYIGAEKYVLELYSKGRISLSRAAELLNKTVYDVLQMAKERGIETGATEEQQKASEKTLKKIKI